MKICKCFAAKINQGTILMKQLQLISVLCATVISFTSLPSQAALVGVLPATMGGTDWQAVYDDDLDISWVANANLADTMNFGVTGINSLGRMDWDKANEFIGAMNTANYLGFNDWRLPNGLQPDATCSIQQDVGLGIVQSIGTGCTGSEMGHLFNIEGVTSAAPDEFSNIQSNYYWSNLEAVFAPAAYVFNPGTGDQSNFGKTSNTVNVWAVHSGNIGAVPVPAAVWLFSSGLLGLVGIARRKKAA